MEHLSSGLRINRASDDAAGLAIAESLNVDSRVYTQAIRNANDTISALDIAAGGLGQLSNIVIRLKELASQAANGTISRTQRTALDKEAFALTNEWNRITQTTSFNGRNLMDSQSGQLNTQLGYGTAGQIGFTLGSELDHATGLTTFGNSTTYAGGTVLRDVTIGDVNGDGVQDIVSAAFNDALGVRVFIGNGDGTFQAPVSYRAVAGAFGTTAVDLGDVNNDGWLDIVALSQTSENTVNVLLNNGNGTFNDTGRTVLAAGTSPNSLDMGDLNGDGYLDIVEGNTTDSTIDVFFGSGNGTFQSRVTYAVGGTGMSGVNIEDMNGDGRPDVLAHTINGVSVFLNQGNGSLGAKTTYGTGNSSGVGVRSLASGDINHDGIIDVVAPSFGNSSVYVFLGNGDGTLGTASTIAVGTGPYNTVLGDLDNDGYLDLLVSGASISGANIYRGGGDGGFTLSSSYGSVTSPLVAALGDLNGDGVLDVATTNNPQIHVKLQNTENKTTVQRFNLTTQSAARSALGSIEQAFKRVSQEIGAVGGIQSRLETATANLRTIFENYRSAESQIRDVDVAQEASDLVRARILEQLSSSILAQANQAPAIGLRLLRGQ